MNALWTLLFLKCSLLSWGDTLGFNVTEPEKNSTFEIELFPPSPTYAGQTRMPRTLFKKIHSGAAFLAGLKLGAVLSKKGFELGHGKIASTHSFQIFGKSVNSAMSLAYGDAGSLLPLADEDSGQSKKSSVKKHEKVFHVAVIEDVSPEIVGEEQQTSEVNGDVKHGLVEDTVEDEKNSLYQNTIEEPEVEKESTFLEEHNQRVKEFNKNLLRRNGRL